MIQIFSSSTDGADSEDLDEKTGSHSDGDEIAEMGIYEADIGKAAKFEINGHFHTDLFKLFNRINPTRFKTLWDQKSKIADSKSWTF